MKLRHFLFSLGLLGSTLAANAQAITLSTDDYGFSYIPRVFTAGNKTMLTSVDDGVVHLYNSDLQEVASVNLPKGNSSYDPVADEVVEFDYFNLDNGGVFDNDAGIYVTQTLFNDDDDYEYAVWVGEDSYNATSMQVKNSAGKTLWELDFASDGNLSGNEPRASIYVLDGKVYLAISYHKSKGGEEAVFYLFKRHASSVEKVATPAAFKLGRTIVNHGETLTVKLSERQKVDKLLVYNAAGAEMIDLNVAAGSKEVTLSNSLPAGTYILSALSRGCTVTSRKIVVR